MMTRTVLYATGLVFLASLAAPPAPAQQDDRAPRRSITSSLNIDALISNYARLLARKYNLNEEQDAYTREYLHAKTYEFLDKHRDELFALVDEMFAARTSGEMTPEEMIDWGKRALPMFEQAKILIIDGNNEWRGILTDEQRAIHDEDLRLMTESFADTEVKLGRIVAGEMTVEELLHPTRPGRDRRVQPAPVHTDQPGALTPKPTGLGAAPAQATPAEPSGVSSAAATEEENRQRARERLQQIRNRDQDPPAGRTPAQVGARDPRPRPGQAAPAARGSENFESEWERYVREFIERYQLNEGQAQKAQSILRQCQEQAASYMAKRKSPIDALDAKIAELGTDKEKAAEVKRLREQRDRLLAPIGRIFEQRLKPSLERLPSSAQREAAQARPAPRRPTNKPAATPPPRPQAPTPPPQAEPQVEPQDDGGDKE